MFEKEAEEADNEKIKENHQFARCARKSYKDGFKDGAEFGYNKANERHNLNKNYKDLPYEGEWVEGLYIRCYKGEPKRDVFKVRWCYEIGELEIV